MTLAKKYSFVCISEQPEGSSLVALISWKRDKNLEEAWIDYSFKMHTCNLEDKNQMVARR